MWFVGAGFVRKLDEVVAEDPAMSVGADAGPRLHAVGGRQQ